ncbi:MAG TPA: adenylate/guanylate cyclase domain-containing protein [Mycobacteriales bacterium]|nr:adenylate/guanylate cyclase domain-containing protein [Mycobacteriales bacterium]
MVDLPTGVVTLMFTDIEGSTRLLHQHGADYGRILDEHRVVVRHALDCHGGIEVSTEGDAFFAAFSNAHRAVQAATDVHAALIATPVRVRIGLHTGTPEARGADYVGLDVHVAARIAAAAHGGQTVLSSATRDQLPEWVDTADLGLHRLKDLPEPLRLFQAGSDAFPPLRSISATNLPAPTSTVVGREDDVAAVQDLLGAHRLVTLTGIGGSGKTRLAIEAAGRTVGAFPDGVLWVDLSAVHDPRLVSSVIARTAGAQSPLAEHISEKRLLLVLDNLEQILSYADELANLLASCPHLRVLATSRTALELAGEAEYDVAPLGLADATELFAERAHQSADPEVVRAVCRRLDGLPLAIELAAARTRLLHPEEMLARLDQRMGTLTSGRRDAPARQRTLRATLEWSHDLLSDEERLLFRRLAVFAGGFDLSAAEAVCECAVDVLESLVRQSLVRRAGRRFLMLETIRELAAERLRESPDGPVVARRHAEHYLTVMRSAHLTMESVGEMRHDIAIAEQDNIRAALSWSVASGETELGIELATALENYWATNAAEEGRRWITDLLASTAAVLPTALRARAYRVRGGATTICGDEDAGLADYELSLAACREVGDDAGVGILLQRLAIAALHDGDLERAQRLGEESMQLLRDAGLPRAEATSLNVLAQLRRACGDDAAAQSLLEDSIELCDRTASRWWQVIGLLDLAELHRGHHRTGAATTRALAAVPLAVAMGDDMHVLLALALLAAVAAQASRPDLAGMLWGAVEAEEAKAAAAQWPAERVVYANLVLGLSGDAAFDQARLAGHDLAPAEAAELARAEGLLSC